MNLECWHEASVFGLEDVKVSLALVLCFLSSYNSIYNDNGFSAVGCLSVVMFSFLTLQGLIAKFVMVSKETLRILNCFKIVFLNEDF